MHKLTFIGTMAALLMAMSSCSDDDGLDVLDIEVPDGYALSAGTSTNFLRSSFAFDEDADWVTGELFQRNEQDQTMLADYLSERCGSRVTLEIRVLDNSGQNKDNYPDLRELGGFDKINMDVETEDE